MLTIAGGVTLGLAVFVLGCAAFVFGLAFMMRAADAVDDCSARNFHSRQLYQETEPSLPSRWIEPFPLAIILCCVVLLAGAIATARFNP